MKLILSIITLLMPLSVVAQNNSIGLEYSFNVRVDDEEIRKNMENNPDFNYSNSFKVFYTKKGVARYIETNNNYIQSSLFNNKKDKLILFNGQKILKTTSGNYNKPDVISIEKNSKIISYKTKTGNYTYIYSDTLTIDALNIGNLKEHCFDLFTKEVNTLPTEVIFSLGIITFEIKLIRVIPLKQEDLLLLNKVIDKPNKRNIKLFQEFTINSN